MEAQFESVCDYCDDDIEKGDNIIKVGSWGWVHGDCAESIADD